MEKTKEEGGRRKKDIINVYDGDFLPFYVCHNKKDAEKKSLQDCLDLCDQFIYNVNKATEANYFVGFLTRGKCFRYRINPDYKAKRDYTTMPDHINDVRNHLIETYGFTWDEEYEADDLVVSFKKDGANCLPISPDKDILNSVLVAYNPRKNEFVNNSIESINEYFWKSMIIGDPIDGIKGIPGRGEAYFKAMMSSTDYSLDFHHRVLDSYIDHFGEYEGIKEFHKNYLSLKLVDNVKIGDVKLNKV